MKAEPRVVAVPGTVAYPLNCIFVKISKMSNADIAAIRKEYSLHTLDETAVASSPVQQFEQWWQQALDAQMLEVNAMTLATCGANNIPDARTVLLKGFDERGFVFFTNYNSAKGRQLQENKNCSLLFFWKELERQVRVSGMAERIPEIESIDYFSSRPNDSKLGAWASPQSSVVNGKNWLIQSFEQYAEQFENKEITKPPHWGGYRVKPLRMEFWQGRPSRMHDRVCYSLQNAQWKIERLAP